ncbi:LAFE_0C07822g1_1 [Lachancea fermentati]|uniref:LAFE_0C07822g1_1 n=1 Tax=Lachancea fermentati TaxID=4955 RepID=A0A1G4M9R7_LACFM|nr:LAFE_0C07822g1_1 [Lachancea fermentati]
MKSLLVFGGNGFLGRRICQVAVEHGYQVTSLSRSGRPPPLSASWEKEWISEVKWQQCDIFNAQSYGQHLKGASNVVHSIGILFEDSGYKKRIRGKSLFTAPDLLKWGANPLKNDPKFTYDMMNKQSALNLAKDFAKPENSNEEARRTFTYISADRGFPLIPKGYIQSKREAEMGLMRLEESIRPIIMRPGFMYDENFDSAEHRDVRSHVKSFVETLNCGNQLLLRGKIPFVNELIRPTVSTQQVGRAIIKNIEDPSFEGVCTLEQILKT